MNALATAPGVIATPGKYYIGAQEVMEYLDCKENKAYELIRQLRDELVKAGKLTPAYPIGKVPRKYFFERYIITIQRPVNGRNLESLNSTMYLQCMASSFVSTKAGAYCSRMELFHSQVQEPSIGSLECRSTREYIKPCRKLLHRMEMELNCLIGRYRQFTR